MELGLRVSLDAQGRTIWIADAHRDDGKRFVVHADEKLTAFLELERATRSPRILLTSWRDCLHTQRRYTDLNQAEDVFPR